ARPTRRRSAASPTRGCRARSRSPPPAGRRARSRRSPATPRAPGPEAAMERAALVNTPSLRKRAVSRGMAGGLGFDGAETLVLPPLDLALMAATLRGAGFAVELNDADSLGLDDAQVYERLDGT